MSKRVEIAGVPFDAVTYPDALEFIRSAVNDGKKIFVTTPNPEMVLSAQKNDEFKNVLKSAQLSIPDGTGVLWASYYLSLPRPKSALKTLLAILFAPKSIRRILPERVTGTDLFYHVVEESQKHKWRIFLLGAETGVAKKAIDALVKKYPKAIFAGSYSGTPAEDEESMICDMINLAKPDILFVAYGSPAQELWINRNMQKLFTVKMTAGVGGAFDFASGKIKRAPKLFQIIGLEWLWRLIREPKRIKRIWNATFVFIRFIIGLK